MMVFMLSLKKNPDERRTQLLLASVLGLFLVLDLFFLFSGQILSFPGSIYLLLTMAIVLLALLVSVFLTVELRVPTWIFLIILSVGLVIASFNTGGVYSSAVLFLIPTSLIAAGLLGRVAGLSWTVFSILVLWWLALEGNQGIFAPPLNQARNISIVFLAVLFIVWWFQYSLKASAEALKNLNSELESQVQLRTDQVLVSEKLSTIGRLTAGLAHELNTPLAAIRSVTESSNQVVQQWHVQDLVTFAKLTESERERLGGLISRCLTAVLQPSLPPSPAVLREWTKTSLHSLIASGVDELVATTLADLCSFLYPVGIQDDLELWKSPRAVEMVQLLERSVTLFQSHHVLSTAARKVSSVVQVLQHQTRTDFSHELTMVDVVEEIELVLILFQGKLRPPLSLVREYQGNPLVQATPEGLGQILINLLTNALQAMNYMGTLTIAVGDESPLVWIEVRDTGPGIPAELAERIFSPFFTTKPAGEGNGLGLDISQRLARSFGGDLGFTSVPGRTVFRLTLPRRLP